MKTLLATLALLPALWTGAVAHAQDHTDKERATDVQRHRAMAAAHAAAVQCLESGQGEEKCLKALQVACKGLAIGKYCGMKHAH